MIEGLICADRHRADFRRDRTWWAALIMGIVCRVTPLAASRISTASPLLPLVLGGLEGGVATPSPPRQRRATRS